MDFLQRAKGLFGKSENHFASYDERSFRRFALLLYVLFATANIITHEMWRDELQAWTISQNSGTPAELFTNMRFEDGHPPLWKLMLYGLSRATHNPASMQYLHLGIAVTSAYIFLRFAPFSRLVRLLFVFGYFPLYEYSTISRSYAAGILLLFCFCAACGAGRKNPLFFCAILFLLIMANAYTFIIAICLLLAIGFKALTDADARADLIGKRWAILLCTIVIIMGLAVSAAIMFPKSGGLFSSNWAIQLDPKKIEQTLSQVWRGFVPIPQFTHCYWNTNILHSMALSSVLAAALLCLALLSLAKKRAVFLFFSLAVGAMLVFQYFLKLAFMRHFGHFFIVFIVALWLERVWGNDKPIGPAILTKLSEGCARPARFLFITLLVIHLGVGLFASVMEWRYPFSQGRNAARYVKEEGLDKVPMVGYMDYAAVTVAGYLDRPFYSPNGDRFGTFAVFDKNWKFLISETTVVEKARHLAGEKKSDVLLVLNMELEGKYDSMAEIKQFTGSIQWDENFYLYLLKYGEQ